jgi:hypothetical protein
VYQNLNVVDVVCKFSKTEKASRERCHDTLPSLPTPHSKPALEPTKHARLLELFLHPRKSAAYGKACHCATNEMKRLVGEGPNPERQIVHKLPVTEMKPPSTKYKSAIDRNGVSIEQSFAKTFPGDFILG